LLDLKSLQNHFQDFLLDQNNLIENHVVATNEVSAQERLAIYYEAYYARLIDIVMEDFPVLVALMGEEKFYHWSRQFIATHPSIYRSARWFGKTFPSFLEAISSEWCAMAQFEWLLTEAFDASNAPYLSLEAIMAIKPEEWPRLVFTCHPSLRYISLQWNVVQVWKNHQCKKKINLKKLSRPQHFIIWRKELAIQFHRLTRVEKFLLDAMQQEISFSTICESLSTQMPTEQVINKIGLLLKNFIVQGLISNITII